MFNVGFENAAISFLREAFVFAEEETSGGTTASGFFMILLLAGCVFFLILDMVRRVRRVRYGALIDEQLDREEQAIRDAHQNVS